ncbi:MULTISPECIES: DUF1707 domain-containing protein [Streptomyces]|uniref:DUF1707 SHOCT-like domain-containing protein n=1 Tax=Streptomyces TaxID=1883 RepID=UPI000D51A8AB|nr:MULTISPECIES: DUF1707 domain-containing protein [Streptomyces]MXG25656.1 DUF1707 domain-containing protein [Streptomyces sp. YIM 132580]PVC65598.1 hypothetical protein DBP15_20545 [Streptomyces sp. CS065A]
MRASDAERERIAELLREAVAEGRLEMDEFEQRLETAYKARTHGELEPLVQDLPAPGTAVAPVGSSAPAPPRGSAASWPARIGGTATSKGGFAFWGGFNRKGRWTVGRKFTAFAMWGGGEIDLREANFEDREVVIRCFAIMGGLHVTAPPELNVDVRGIGIMGGFGEGPSEEGETVPQAPRVTITGLALMGGVGVERKRTKAERRRLEEAEEAERAVRERRGLDGGEGEGRGRKELG